MIIAANDEKELDEVLKTVLQRTEEKNTRFDKNKIQFKVNSVKNITLEHNQ